MTPGTAAHQAPLSLTISQSLLKLMSIESVTPSNHLILCRPLLLPSIFPSIRVFSSELALLTGWPKCWSFSFSVSPSNEYSGLISFRIDCFDLLAVQGTLKSLLQHHNLKASTPLFFVLFPKAGVPNPWDRNEYWFMTWQALGHTAGCEQWAAEGASSVFTAAPRRQHCHLRPQMMVASQLCLTPLQSTILSGFKSRWNILDCHKSTKKPASISKILSL